MMAQRLDLPVTQSMMRFTSEIFPKEEKYLSKVSWVVASESPPTKRLRSLLVGVAGVSVFGTVFEEDIC